MDLAGLDFSIDGYVLLAAFLFGIIGMWLFREGRKKANIELTLVGLALMIYPYFVSGRAANWGIGIVLCARAYYIWES